MTRVGCAPGRDQRSGTGVGGTAVPSPKAVMGQLDACVRFGQHRRQADR